jgi:hypothetical protein
MAAFENRLVGWLDAALRWISLHLAQSTFCTLAFALEASQPAIARIGAMRALNRHIEREFDSLRREAHLGQAKAGTGSVTAPRRYLYRDQRLCALCAGCDFFSTSSSCLLNAFVTSFADISASVSQNNSFSPSIFARWRQNASIAR